MAKTVNYNGNYSGDELLYEDYEVFKVVACSCRLMCNAILRGKHCDFLVFSDLIDLRPRESWMSRRTIWISWFAKRRSDSPAPRPIWSVWRDRGSFIALDQSWTKDDSPHMIWKSKQFTSLIGGSSGEINLAPKKISNGREMQPACERSWLVPGPGPTSKYGLDDLVICSTWSNQYLNYSR